MNSNLGFGRRKALGLIVGAMVCPLTAGAQAETYPAKPIRLVVAFSAGGPTDIIARVIARDMSARLGQQIIVDNRPGAGGNIAAEYVAKSPADGYTLLYNSSSIAISPALYRNARLDPDQIFAPVGYAAKVPLVLLVNAASPVKTPADFIKLLKARPGQLNFGSSGNGTIDHLTSVVFADKTRTSFNHVPYKGNAAALPDLLAGRIDFMMSGSLNAILPFIKDGKLRALAATTSKRVSVLPDVPTLAETVLPGFDSGTWQGIVAPKGTPTPVVMRLNKELNATLGSPAVVKALRLQGADPTGGTPGQYRELIHAEYVRWTSVVKETGATAG